jgi:hypothetical protein
MDLNLTQLSILKEIQQVPYATSLILSLRMGVERKIIERAVRKLEDPGWVEIQETLLPIMCGTDKNRPGPSIYVANPAFSQYLKARVHKVLAVNILKHLNEFKAAPIRVSRIAAKIRILQKKLKQIQKYKVFIRYLDVNEANIDSEKLDIAREAFLIPENMTVLAVRKHISSVPKIENEIRELQNIKVRKPVLIAWTVIYKIMPFDYLEHNMCIGGNDDLEYEYKQYLKHGTFENSCGLPNESLKAYLKRRDTEYM